MQTSNQSLTRKVAVVGGRGYAGLELIRLLQKHPHVYLRAAFSAQAGFSFADYLPRPKKLEIPVVPISDLEAWVPELDTIFLATPAETSLQLAPSLLAAGVNVIDLSGAFRLSEGTDYERRANYEKWYGLDHSQPKLLEKAIYGLVPWNQKKFSPGSSQLVANPGCYATAVLMALLPLLKRDLIDPNSLVIDAKSGTSGAGRGLKENLLFTEVEGECLPYRVGAHQHLPEICQLAKIFSGVSLSPFFTTHLLNVRRGILAGIYAKVSTDVGESEFSAAYALDYSDYGLVDWGTLTQLSDRAAGYRLSLKRTVGTARTSLYFQIVGEKLYLFSLIDNLLKGAASQAIENFNQLHGWAASAGLTELEGVL